MHVSVQTDTLFKTQELALFFFFFFFLLQMQDATVHQMTSFLGKANFYGFGHAELFHHVM